MPIDIELPSKYYLGHFRDMLQGVCERYAYLLKSEEHDFIREFHSLSEDAQCTYVRMVNRKGRVFFKADFNYSEILNAPAALNELEQRSFTCSPAMSDMKDVIKVLPKDHLLELLRKHEINHKKSWSRSRIVETLLSIETLPEKLLPELSPQLLVQLKVKELTTLLFIFFGEIQSDLQLYTLRDLGVRRANGKSANFRPKFSSREEADSLLFYHLLNDDPKAILLTPEQWPRPLNHEAQTLREAGLTVLGDMFKKKSDLDTALKYLSFCEQHPGREKKVRLLYQCGKTEEAEKLLNELIENPSCDEELLFAHDFLAMKFQKKRTSLLTDTLRNSPTIWVDGAFFRSPELGIIDHFKKQNIEAHHTENWPWNALFGILFWEELKDGVFHGEFERLPHDLMGPAFYQNHQNTILDKLDHLHAGDFLKKYDDLYGTPNGIFGWDEGLRSILSSLLTASGTGPLREVLLAMSKDFRGKSTGFPDLMVIKDGKVSFIEVKAPGDSLKKTQLLQLQLLNRAGLESTVLKVDYRTDTDHTYVVVDVETTGGSSSWHRITELGAVKIKNNHIIGQFQTLVNPERSIPREIQQLTGITNDMVKDAPKFVEVAVQFKEFCQDSIFVAHNVAFDYGFIQKEFERIDDKFVRPFLCTRALTKKHWPDLPSYSLKNLCNHFRVDLADHHRALCDALATAQIMLLINEKRQEVVAKCL